MQTALERYHGPLRGRVVWSRLLLSDDHGQAHAVTYYRTTFPATMRANDTVPAPSGVRRLQDFGFALLVLANVIACQGNDVVFLRKLELENHEVLIADGADTL